MNEKARMVITLLGDYQKNATVHTKHRYFFDALARHFEIIDIFDAGLKGADKVLNALSVFHPDRSRWRIHFYKNHAAFEKRSLRASEFLKSNESRIDVALQIGALFDSTVSGGRISNIIYSDYTSVLSSTRPEGGRSLSNDREEMRWISLEASALKNAAHVCTRSNYVRASLIEDYSMPPEKVTVVGGGVNFERLPVLTEKPPNREPVILFVGKEFHRKGGDLLLQAFHLVTMKRPTARLTLVTAGPVPQELVLQNVTVITEECSRERMSALYSHSDVFVLPSRLETWGDVLLEAMAHGLPCIGVRSDAMEEIIDDGRNGFLVSSGDVRTMADRILNLLRNHELRRSMSAAARKKVEAEFLWDHVAARMAPILNRFAAQNRDALVQT